MVIKALYFPSAPDQEPGCGIRYLIIDIQTTEYRIQSMTYSQQVLILYEVIMAANIAELRRMTIQIRYACTLAQSHLGIKLCSASDKFYSDSENIFPKLV